VDRGERTGSTAVGGGVQSSGASAAGTGPHPGAGLDDESGTGAVPPEGGREGGRHAERRSVDRTASSREGQHRPGGETPQEKTSTPSAAEGPFSPRQLFRLDEALSAADRETGLTFSVYVGELAEPTRATVERLLEQLPDPDESVLLAVSPGQRVLEIVTGANTTRRLPDRVCALAALSMTASFGGGDLTGGIVTGLRMLADQAAQGVRSHRGTTPDRRAGDPTV